MSNKRQPLNVSIEEFNELLIAETSMVLKTLKIDGVDYKTEAKTCVKEINALRTEYDMLNKKNLIQSILCNKERCETTHMFDLREAKLTKMVVLSHCNKQKRRVAKYITQFTDVLAKTPL